MAVPSGGVTKASVDGVGTKYDGELIQDGILDFGRETTAGDVYGARQWKPAGLSRDLNQADLRPDHLLAASG